MYLATVVRLMIEKVGNQQSKRLSFVLPRRARIPSQGAFQFLKSQVGCPPNDVGIGFSSPDLQLIPVFTFVY